MNDVSMQINLSAGDIAYAAITVPALVKAHRPNVAEVYAVVDCCRPQKTRTLDPECKFPKEQFAERVERICNIAETLKSQGMFDRLEFMQPGDPRVTKLSKKYMAGLITETHDAKGTGLSSYFLAIDCAKTQYLLHYDADMLLYQRLGYDWVVEARARMDKESYAFMASPRVSPPFAETEAAIGPSLHKGDDPAVPISGGWRVRWTSARCFLLDRAKLTQYLPLVKGKVLFEVIARKLLGRDYPPSSEMLLFKRVCRAGGWRLDLRTECAWLLHPGSKEELFMRLLPKILTSVQEGYVPEAQRGWEDLKLEAWERFLSDKSQPAPIP
jgi:hypothetical protein